MSKFLAAAALTAVALVASACGPVTERTARELDGETIRVVATIGMIADAAERVGGERVSVEGLMGPGIDPHLYKASEGDLRRLERSDVIFYGGLHLEAKMADVLERIADQRATQAVTDAIPRSRLLSPAQFKGQPDPHVWFDVELWAHAVEQVRDTLSELDPESRELYRTNADAYLAELRELDRYVAEQSARVPRERRVLITAHDAFGYFGEAYGFEVRGLQGITTAAEAGAGDVQALAELHRRAADPGDLRRVVGVAPDDHGGAGGGAQPRLRRRDRRLALLRRDGRRGHARGHLHRHGAAQRGHDRRRVAGINTAGMNAVEVTDLTVAYREKPVLWDVDLTCRRAC